MTAELADDNGKGRRLHKTIRAEFLLEHDRRLESIVAVQAARYQTALDPRRSRGQTLVG